jgi:hypothetical protein
MDIIVIQWQTQLGDHYHFAKQLFVLLVDKADNLLHCSPSLDDPHTITGKVKTILTLSDKLSAILTPRDKLETIFTLSLADEL